MSQPLRRGLRARAAVAAADDSVESSDGAQCPDTAEQRAAASSNKRRRGPSTRAQSSGSSSGGVDGGARGVLLARLRREASFRSMCDQAVVQSVLGAICTLRAAGQLDLGRLRSVVSTWLGASTIRSSLPPLRTLLDVTEVLLGVDWRNEVLQRAMGGHAHGALDDEHMRSQLALLGASTSQELAASNTGDAMVSCAATYKGRTRMRSNDRFRERFMGVGEDEEEEGALQEHPLLLWARLFSPEGMASFAERWTEASCAARAPNPSPPSSSRTRNKHASTSTASALQQNNEDGDDSAAYFFKFSMVATCVDVDGQEFMARVKVWGRNAGTGSVTAGIRINATLKASASSMSVPLTQTPVAIATFDDMKPEEQDDGDCCPPWESWPGYDPSECSGAVPVVPVSLSSGSMATPTSIISSNVNVNNVTAPALALALTSCPSPGPSMVLPSCTPTPRACFAQDLNALLGGTSLGLVGTSLPDAPPDANRSISSSSISSTCSSSTSSIISSNPAADSNGQQQQPFWPPQGVTGGCCSGLSEQQGQQQHSGALSFTQHCLDPEALLSSPQYSNITGNKDGWNPTSLQLGAELQARQEDKHTYTHTQGLAPPSVEAYSYTCT